MTQRFFHTLAAAALAAFLSAAGVAAQSDGYVTNSNQRGVLPFGSYQLDSIDSVNLGTGAVNFNIPLWTRKGRGLDYSSQIGYSSKIWVIEPYYGNPMFPESPTHFQWRKTARPEAVQRGPYGELEYQEQFYDCPYSGGTFTARVRSNFSYTDSGGATYRFPNRDYRASLSLVCDATSNYNLSVGNSDSGAAELNTSGDPYVIRFKDGRRLEIPFYGGAHKLTGANGNFIGNGLDTVGRTAGLLKDSNGTTRSFTTTYSNISVATQFPTNYCGALPLYDYNNNLQVLTRLDLPNGLAYTFQYHPTFGEIQRIDLPTGGYIRYEWTTIAAMDNPPDSALACGYIDSRRVWKRHVSPDGVAENTWTYSYSRDANGDYTTTVTDPLGNVSVHKFLYDGIHELRTEVRQGASTVLQTVDNTWKTDYGPVQSHNLDDQFDYDSKNWRLSVVKRTLNSTNQVSQETFAWDGDSSPSIESRVNLLEKKEYDYGAGGPGTLKRRTTYSYLHDSNSNYLNRHILDRVTFQTVYQGQSTLKAQTENRYDTQTLTATSGVVQHDYSGYGWTMNIRGNLTEERRWLNTTGAWLTTVHTYDDLGNRLSTQDPKGYTTSFDYTDSWFNTACLPSGGTARAYLTKVTNPMGHIRRASHYSCSSLPGSETDANNRVSYFYYDAVDRPTREVRPDGGETNVFYSDLQLNASWQGNAVFQNQASSLPLRVKAYRRIESSPVLESSELAVYDGLARVSMNGASNGSSRDWTRTEYDGLGRLRRTSNPITLSDVTDEPASWNFTRWETTDYDALGRVTRLTHQDGQYTTWVYSGNYVTVTDPAQAKRRQWNDALGRITQLRENNPTTGSLTSGYYTTTYVYDALDNLTQVNQGSQTRSFVYDSLSRLSSETQPEWGTPSASSGTVTLQYDANSNLTSKTDPRGIVASYGYDPLNRLTSIDYSDATPPVDFSYDSTAVSNGKGRRTGMSDGIGTTVYHYDTMGRTSKMVWTTSAFSQTGEFVYNLAGGLKQSKWPGIWDGPTPLTIYWSYDNSGRQTSAWWSNNGGGAYQELADGASFTYTGASSTTWAEEVTELSNGTVETITYNDRMQPRQRRLTNPSTVWSLDYDFYDGANQNNGNVIGIDETTPGWSSNRDMTFDYDKLNRIWTASSPGQWGLSYSFDRYGNRLAQTKTFGNPPTNSLTYNAARNRITTSGYGYDDAGNLTSAPGATYQYDASNQIKSVDGGSTGAYAYDGDGRRVRRVANGETRHYLRDPAGNPVWEHKTGVGWESFNLYFNDKHLVINNTTEGLRWRHQDHLGSLRVKTDSAGNVTCRYWYMPYGELWDSFCSEADRRLFTDQERDPETGMDYFIARHYPSWMGRFMSVDPALSSGVAEDPQTWNRYAYTSNNPLNRIDPDGRRWFVKDGKAQWVEVNEDGTYTSPGDGWVEFDPETADWWNIVAEVDGQLAYLSETADGQRIQVPVEAGLEDATDEAMAFLGAAQIGRSLLRVGGKAALAEARNLLSSEAGFASIGGSARNQAAKIGSELVKKLKSSGVGSRAGRSGGHGAAFKRAGAELIRMAKVEKDSALKQALLVEGKRLIAKGKSISHK